MEILTGGRVTAAVLRDGNIIRRTRKPSSENMRAILEHLSNRVPELVPQYLGAENGFDLLSYLPGDVPTDLGHFSDDACRCAARIIRRLHDAGKDFPGLSTERTLCHCDLSPCNFVFREGLPNAVIDWDAAQPGDPLDDLAYALWMWLDIGNPEQSGAYVHSRITMMLEAYSSTLTESSTVYPHILSEMRRVGCSIFPTEAQTAATREWTQRCIVWCEQQLKPELQNSSETV